MATIYEPPAVGLSFLTSYSGILKISEEVINIVLIITIAVSGYTLEGHSLNAVIIIAALVTAVLTFLHCRGETRRTGQSWHWAECISLLLFALFIAIFATYAMSVYTTAYIIIGIFAYLDSAIYFLDTFNSYQIATAPVVQYAWTTPNMPDLN